MKRVQGHVSPCSPLSCYRLIGRRWCNHDLRPTFDMHNWRCSRLQNHRGVCNRYGYAIDRIGRIGLCDSSLTHCPKSRRCEHYRGHEGACYSVKKHTKRCKQSQASEAKRIKKARWLRKQASEAKKKACRTPALAAEARALKHGPAQPKDTTGHTTKDCDELGERKAQTETNGSENDTVQHVKHEEQIETLPRCICCIGDFPNTFEVGDVDASKSEIEIVDVDIWNSEKEKNLIPSLSAESTEKRRDTRPSVRGFSGVGTGSGALHVHVCKRWWSYERDQLAASTSNRELVAYLAEQMQRDMAGSFEELVVRIEDAFPGGLKGNKKLLVTFHQFNGFVITPAELCFEATKQREEGKSEGEAQLDDGAGEMEVQKEQEEGIKQEAEAEEAEKEQADAQAESAEQKQETQTVVATGQAEDEENEGFQSEVTTGEAAAAEKSAVMQDGTVCESEKVQRAIPRASNLDYIDS